MITLTECSKVQRKKTRSLSSLSISDSHIKHCSNMVIQRMLDTAAKKTLEVEELNGVTFKGDENVVIEKIKEMEERDHKIITSKGLDNNL